MKKIEIANADLRAEFQPEWGGLFSALKYNHPEHGWVDAFVTEDQKPAAVKKTPYFGCFLMVPFANRMTDGLIKTTDTQFPFPIVVKPENLAIHGTGWDKPWAVSEQSETSVTMQHSWSSDDDRYRFQARLSAHLQGTAIHLDLMLENLSEQALPMGLGFHPWFSDINRACIRFGDPLLVNRESPWNVYPQSDFGALPGAFAPVEFDGLDASFDGWSKRLDIDFFDKGLSLEMTGAGALDRVHVFVMGQNDRFCLEPVSHKPGDLRDPKFLVAPGDSVSGQMKLGCSSI